MSYTILNEQGTTAASNGLTGQWAYAARTIDVDGIYVDINIPIENDQWGGQRQIEVTVFARPSKPVKLRVFAGEWPAPESSYSRNAEARAKSYKAALDRLSDQAEEWVRNYCLVLDPADR